MNRYLIGSGYHFRSDWDADMAQLWCARVTSSVSQETDIVVIGTGSEFPVAAPNISVINGQNLGHVGDYVNATRVGHLCGWSASVLALAMIAYNHSCDLVFMESDCLAFGPWLEQAYADLGDGEFIFGKAHTSTPWMECSQSLFVIRNSFLLEFVREYLSLPEDAKMLPEAKFCEIERRHPAKTRRLSFGVDRQRPIPFDATVWYGQQWTAEEIDQLKERGLC